MKARISVNNNFNTFTNHYCVIFRDNLNHYFPNRDGNHRDSISRISCLRKATPSSWRVNSAISSIHCGGLAERLIPVDILSIRANPLKVRRATQNEEASADRFPVGPLFFRRGDRGSNRVKCTCTAANCQTAIASAAGDESEDLVGH